MSLREEVCHILYADWDPIGIRAFGGPVDEYDTYADTIVRFIRERRDIDKLTSHLQLLQRQSMGLASTDADRDRHVAEKLIALKT